MCQTYKTLLEGVRPFLNIEEIYVCVFNSVICNTRGKLKSFKKIEEDLPMNATTSLPLLHRDSLIPTHVYPQVQTIPKPTFRQLSVSGCSVF